MELNRKDRWRTLWGKRGVALARGRSLWQRASAKRRALALALCLAPALILALVFSRGADGAQPGDGDPFRASARMRELLAPAADAAAVDLPSRAAHAPAALAPLELHLRGRLQMREGPVVVLLEVEGVRGLQRLAVGETRSLRSAGAERSLRVVEDGTRDLWVSMDGGAPVALR